MKLVPYHARLALASAAMFSLPLASQAVTLNTPVAPAPYADTTLPGTTAAARPELAGLVLQDVLTPFSFDGITGTVQNRVVRENGTGTLDFYWKINVDSNALAVTGAPFDVTALRLENFGLSNITDSDWRIDGLGTQSPDTARLFSATSQPNGAVNFLFDTHPVHAGQSSNFFFLHTSATDYAQIADYDLLGNNSQGERISGQFSTFAPVPEPGTAGLTLAGLAIAAAVTRRQRQ